MDYIDYLTEYGLTRQEATIYVELLRHGYMTGYEVSKETGISKSNVYAALKGLTQKGAAVVEEGEATRYLPVEVEQFCDNHLRYLSEMKKKLSENKPKKLEVAEGYITIQSERHIKDKMIEMLEGCEYRVYIMADRRTVNLVRDYLIKMCGDGKKVVILSDEDVDIPCATTYITDVDKGQIRFITDSSKVLTGSLFGTADDTCLYSGQENLVDLVKETLKNKMLLANKVE